MAVHVLTGKNASEVFYWTNVMPGDLVISPGATAFLSLDFKNRTEDTRVLHLRQGHLLVLARIDGVPGEEKDPESRKRRTFVVHSRHGILVLLQYIHDQ